MKSVVVYIDVAEGVDVEEFCDKVQDILEDGLYDADYYSIDIDFDEDYE